jgi:hypothetical protein
VLTDIANGQLASVSWVVPSGQASDHPGIAPGASPAYADATTKTGDLSDCFDFNQTPLTFQTIPAPVDAKHFLEDKNSAHRS